MVDINILKGKVLSDIRTNDNEIQFETIDNEVYVQKHIQECCESVTIEDIIGDLNDLINKPILIAEKRVSKNLNDIEDASPGIQFNLIKKSMGSDNFGDEDQKWTFYELATINGSVTIRWYGTSNGYYSTDVDFYKL